MPIIRQGSLFTLEELFDMEPTHRFDEIFSTIDINPILRVVSKKSSYGSPVQLNYAAMVYSLVARITERIPTIKDLVKRLKNDFIFRLDCGFLLSDTIPSEASYSRMIAKITETNVLEQVQEALLIQAISECFVTDNTIAIDATHIEARDRALVKEKEISVEPKKRGRKTKSEREKWLQEQIEKESNLSIYEKPIEAQLEVSLDELLSSIPLNPEWGIKKNSEGKNFY